MSNFIKQDFTKSNLQLGQILETREGELFVNAGVQWLSKNDWLRPDDYNDNLIESNSEELDIIKIYELNPASIRGFNFNTPDTEYLKLIWERVEKDEIKYEKIEFITALRLMRNNEEVFVEFTKDSIFLVELIEFYSGSISTYLQTLKLPNIREGMSEYLQITDALNYQFYRKVN